MYLLADCLAPLTERSSTWSPFMETPPHSDSLNKALVTGLGNIDHEPPLVALGDSGGWKYVLRDLLTHLLLQASDIVPGTSDLSLNCRGAVLRQYCHSRMKS